MNSEPSDDELPIAGGPSEGTHPATTQEECQTTTQQECQQREDSPSGGADCWPKGPPPSSSQYGPDIKYVYTSRTTRKVLSESQCSQYLAKERAIEPAPRVEAPEGIATSKPKRDRVPSQKGTIARNLGVSSDDEDGEDDPAPRKKARRNAKSTEGGKVKHREQAGYVGSVHDDQQAGGGDVPSKAAKHAAGRQTAGQRATERVLPSSQCSFAQDLIEKLVVWFSLHWPDREHPFTEEARSDHEKLAAYLRVLGFEMISEKKTSHATSTAGLQRQVTAPQHAVGVKKSEKDEPKQRPLKRTPVAAEAQKPQSAPSDVQEIAKLRKENSELKKKYEEHMKELDELRKKIKEQTQNAEKLAQAREEAVAAAVKETEAKMMAEREEEKKEQRARQLLEDPVDDDDEAGDPITCLEAMQVLDCPERNFCVSLIAQWLAPKWLVASKAAAIEESLFRHWCDRVSDSTHKDGVRQVVGPRYRVRAKQLSMKMCPIGLSPLTHKSPMGFLPRDPTDEQVNALIESVEEHLLVAGEVRGKLWSGELDFATFVCDILIDNGLVPNQAPSTICGDKPDRAAQRNPAMLPRAAASAGAAVAARA